MLVDADPRGCLPNKLTQREGNDLRSIRSKLPTLLGDGVGLSETCISSHIGKLDGGEQLLGFITIITHCPPSPRFVPTFIPRPKPAEGTASTQLSCGRVANGAGC